MYDYYDSTVPFETLKGVILTDIQVNDGRDEITFLTLEGNRYKLYHSQDCCESVTVEDICGDFSDLVDTPILLAEEVTSNENPEGYSRDWQESFTWTFYKLSTFKGSVTIRWYGESNGYYSESVSFVKL